MDIHKLIGKEVTIRRSKDIKSLYWGKTGILRSVDDEKGEIVVDIHGGVIFDTDHIEEITPNRLISTKITFSDKKLLNQIATQHHMEPEEVLHRLLDNYDLQLHRTGVDLLEDKNV